MMLRIATFELRYQVRSLLFCSSVVVFFLLTFASVVTPNITLGVPASVHVNSPFAILQSIAVTNLVALFVVTGFVANVVIRDRETRFAPLLYATPLSKRDYLIGRFAAAMLAAQLLLLTVPLAIMIGSLMPWVDPHRLGPFVPAAYLYGLLVVGLPGLLISGAGLFALATATRSMLWSYLGLIAFFVLYSVGDGLLGRLGNEPLAALLEPFGIGALQVATRYWTVAQRDSQLPALAGVLLLSRLLWLAVAAVMWAAAYGRFRFEAYPSGKRAPCRSEGAVAQASRPLQRPAAVAPWSAFAALTRFEVQTVLRSPALYVLLLLAALNTFPNLSVVAARNGIEFLPVTRSVVEELQGLFVWFPGIIAIYYSGELVWRDRERRIHELVDACPAPSWTLLTPKVLATGLVLCATLVMGVAAGMLFQLAQGYLQLEPLHYLLWFLLPQTLLVWQLAVAAVCIQSLVPHKAAGHALLLLLLLLDHLLLPALGYEHGLYRYAYTPPVLLSDLNGMGRFWIGRAWFELCWSAFAGMLLMASVLLLRRGAQTRLLPRLAQGWHSLKGPQAAILAVCAVVWLGSACFIYYNTNILNDHPHHTPAAMGHFRAAYERELLRYETVPQPRIVAVQLAVQLFPRQTRADTAGSYVLENQTAQPISVLHVSWLDPLRMVKLDMGPAVLEKDYPELNHRIYRLTTPIAPGERRTVHFNTRLEERGFPNGEGLWRIVENGTYLQNWDISPILGISRAFLLTDRAARRAAGLPDAAPPPDATRPTATQGGRPDSDWVSAHVSITTDADQTPLGPGETVSDTVTKGRRTAVMRSEAPIMHAFAIQSGRYAHATDLWTAKNGRTVALAVYYHPPQQRNVARILNALKASLEVYSERFGPYPLHAVRIAEFPGFHRYESLPGEGAPGTMPFSEGAFILRVDDRHPDSSIDQITYAMAHELAHQWWGNQVAGANGPGNAMLQETFAQYSAMLVMEKLYGPEQIRKFLKYELDLYLRWRGDQGLGEVPLARVGDQQYVSYFKGSLVMYRLKELVGEEAVDRALRRLLATYAFKPAPFPSPKDFMSLLRQEAPGHDEEISDLFERITLYDLKAHDAVAHRRPDGRYEVRFIVDGRKVYADGRGRETQAPLDEPFEVGAFSVEPGTSGYRPESGLKLERAAIRSGSQTLTLTLDKLPKVVGIDPFNTRIDRGSGDNLTPVRLQ